MKFKSVFLATVLIILSGFGGEKILPSLSQSGLVDETICGIGKREAYFETERYLIYICHENKKLFYVSFLKSNPQQWFKIPVKRLKKNKYEAFYQGKFLEINPQNLIISLDKLSTGKHKTKKDKQKIISSESVIIFVPKKKKALSSSDHL